MKRYPSLIFGAFAGVIITAFLFLAVSSCDNNNDNRVQDASSDAVETTQNCLFGISYGQYTLMLYDENGPEETLGFGTFDKCCNSMTSFTMADGRQYIFGHCEDDYGWFIQEILPTGDMGRETCYGNFEHYFPILSAFTIPDGKTFLYGQMKVDKADGSSSSFWFTMEIKAEGILDINTLTDGYWSDWYPNALVTNANSESPVLFAEDSDGNWFLRPISKDGKIQPESATGKYTDYYDAIQTYTVGGTPYLFGSRDSSTPFAAVWFIQDLLTGTITDSSGTTNYTLDAALLAPLYINDQTFLVMQGESEGFCIYEIVSDGSKMGSMIYNTTSPGFQFLLPVFFDTAYLETNHWMTNIYDLIKDRTLQEIAIPGSHDAGMNNMDGNTNCLTRGNACDTQTQLSTIYEQLGYGSRYFDIRPAKYTMDADPWYTAHLDDADVIGWCGCAGQTMDSVLDDVLKFIGEQETLVKDSKELIILNFSHCYEIWTDDNGDYQGCDCSNDDWVSLRDSVVKTLGGFLVNWSQYQNPAQAIFGDRDASQFVLLRFETDAFSSEPASGVYTANDFPIYNNYSNTNDFSTMSTDQEQKLKDAQNHEEDLFLLSWTLTLSSGQAYDCEWGTNPTSILDLAYEADSQLMVYMDDWGRPRRYDHSDPFPKYHIR